ncbi:hypothetical protein FQZ97_1268890 [compost metagenome]
MSGLGVPAGATSPPHAVTENFRSSGIPDSATVGTLGRVATGFVAATARARNLPARISGSDVEMLSNMTCTCPAMRSFTAGELPL